MKKKLKRVVLGVGYPWFFASTGKVVLYTKENGMPNGKPVFLKSGYLGDWNKIRLVAEVLK